MFKVVKDSLILKYQLPEEKYLSFTNKTLLSKLSFRILA